MKVVISQPMYFPWVGLFEQIRLADIYVHLDDAQFTRGFFNRVQVKTEQGCKWITVPLINYHRGQNINEVKINNEIDWRSQHLNILRNAYRRAPHAEEMLNLVDEVLVNRYENLALLSAQSIVKISNYFDLNPNVEFKSTSDLQIDSKNSDRILAICKMFQAQVYITGHGARNYLNHELFLRSNIEVEYMNYLKVPYNQVHGSFTPYVSVLDLIASKGKEGVEIMKSASINWRLFLGE